LGAIGCLIGGFLGYRFDYSLALYIDAALIVVALSIIPFLSDRKEKMVARPVEPAIAAT